MKTTTWVPKSIAVARQDDATLSHALLIEDESETVMIPMTRGDARRIGAALLGYDTCESCGRVVALDGHVVTCPAQRVEATHG